jgi:hypothetical protein
MSDSQVRFFGMRFTTRPDSDSQIIPSAKVRSSIQRRRRPSIITIDIPMIGEGASRSEAFTNFQSEMKAFQDVAEVLGDKIASSKVGMPSETEEEVERAFRRSTVYRVAAKGAIAIEASTGLGDVLVELVRREFEFETPQFEYPEITQASPEDYEELCARARAIAEASARASGCAIGRVLSIDFPSPLEGRRVLQPMRDSRIFMDIDFMTTNDDSTRLDSKLFDLLSTDVPTYDDEFIVEITFELV